MRAKIGMSVLLVKFKDFDQHLLEQAPQLFNVLSKLEKINAIDFYKVRLPFGLNFIHKGRINTEIFKGRVPGSLSYSTIPLSLVLKGACEVFVEMIDRVVPLNIIRPNELFGVFEVLSYLCGIQAKPSWSVSSGARSCFLLPKISNSIKHSALKKKFNMVSGAPISLSEHHSIFSEICKNSEWATELIIFPKDLLTSNTPTALFFQKYLFEIGWKNSEHLRSSVNLDFLWNSFAEIIKKRNLKPNIYVMDSLKHLVMLGLGLLPGFRAVKNNALMDFELIKAAYKESYGLASPIIFEPAFCKKTKKENYVYYSLGYPTIYHGAPVMSHAPTNIADLRDLKILANMLSDFCSVHQEMKHLSELFFEFFHTDRDQFGEINNANEIYEEILKGQKETIPESLPRYWQFGRGCVRVGCR